MPNTLVAGDTASKVVVTCKDEATKQPIDLTGKTAQVRFKIEREATTDVAAVVKDADITDPDAGIVEYQFEGSDLQAGTLKGEVVITNDDDTFMTQSEPFEIEVRAVLK